VKPESLSSKEFLRARRPENFSDTVVLEQPILDRSLLEYHLDTLTSRSQEVEFERFARRLAEQEICPNLLPQTGPTGGGDSKVDSETYPVADDLALGWYVGIGREAASERWGFAFSTMKRWRSKLRSDVAKMAATSRGYRKGFFVSNQFIRDKVRGELEDELTKRHGLDVRILDRTWILDKVFGNGHEDLAIEELGISISTRRQPRMGPLDIQRESDLRETEQRIREALGQRRFGAQLVDDCIGAAILSRELEQPRVQTEGLFDRADRMAAGHGTPHQQLECAYQRAWTAFWWHEDFEQFSKLYGDVEGRAKGSWNAHTLERLLNLWCLLRTATRADRSDEMDAMFQAHTDTLLAELERLGSDENLPSTSLQAQTMLLEMQLMKGLASREPLEGVLRDLQEVIRKSEGLAGYPFEPQVEILTELGEFLCGVPAYDELFEAIVRITSARRGEVSASRMLLRRGEQQLAADQPYDAIRLLGRALRSLYKHESRHDSVRALYLCGCAYERVGLLWAARGVLLAAASLATDEWWRYEEATPLQAMCYRRLKWLELQLGRLPQTLAWHDADGAVRDVLASQGYDEARLSEGDPEFDLMLGALLLKTDFRELERLSTLPDTLERLGLSGSSTALLYALGYEADRLDEGFQEAWGNEDLHAVFLKWRDRGAMENLPPRPLLCDTATVTLGSTVLGCRIIVESENASPCVELGESVLAALEGMLSTSMLEGIVAHEPILSVSVRKSPFAKPPFEFELQERAGRPHCHIHCSTFDPCKMPLETQQNISDRLLELLVTIISRVVLVEDPQTFFERLVHGELAVDRSIVFARSFVTIGNVLGHEPKFQMSSWLDPGSQEYAPRRSKTWDADDAHSPRQECQAWERSTFGSGRGEPPTELLERSQTKHTQIQVVSHIRQTLWDEAEWHATVFLTFPDGSTPPALALAFKGKEAARDIFVQWCNELGVRDDGERLRITIVRGIDWANPFSYRVAIGTNPEGEWSQQQKRYVVLSYRVNTMAPTSGLNLERFISSYEGFGFYFFVPAFVNDDLSDVEILWDCRLIKRELHVREAWQIGRHDVDAAAVVADDAPIIPDGQETPPVLDLLRWRRSLSSPSSTLSEEPG